MNFSSINKGIYVWGATQFNDSDFKGLLKACRKNNINFILLSISDSLLKEQIKLKSFMEKAHKKRLFVSALSGVNINISSSDKLKKRLQNILKYNFQVHPYQKFDTAHFDIEPYANPDIKILKQTNPVEFDNKFKKILVHQLELFKWFKLVAKNSLQIGADFPFWYDVVKQNQEKREVIVNYNGISKPVSQHIMDVVDYSCVMAYGDSSEKCIRYANKHLEYAKKRNRPLFISLNCNDGKITPIQPSSSFFNKGKRAFKNSIKEVARNFRQYKFFKGIIIHDYRSFRSF
jgi:hypothetical protein